MRIRISNAGQEKSSCEIIGRICIGVDLIYHLTGRQDPKDSSYLSVSHSATGNAFATEGKKIRTNQRRVSPGHFTQLSCRLCLPIPEMFEKAAFEGDSQSNDRRGALKDDSQSLLHWVLERVGQCQRCRSNFIPCGLVGRVVFGKILSRIGEV